MKSAIHTGHIWHKINRYFLPTVTYTFLVCMVAGIYLGEFWFMSIPLVAMFVIVFFSTGWLCADMWWVFKRWGVINVDQLKTDFKLFSVYTVPVMTVAYIVVILFSPQIGLLSETGPEWAAMGVFLCFPLLVLVVGFWGYRVVLKTYGNFGVCAIKVFKNDTKTVMAAVKKSLGAINLKFKEQKYTVSIWVPKLPGFLLPTEKLSILGSYKGLIGKRSLILIRNITPKNRSCADKLRKYIDLTLQNKITEKK